MMQINPRTSLAFCVKALIIVCCWAVSFYATFFGFQSFSVRNIHRPQSLQHIAATHLGP